MSEKKISFWKKLFGKKGMPMEEPDASADLNEEVGQTAVAEAVKERKIRQKLQLPANMQSETAENVPDSRKKWCFTGTDVLKPVFDEILAGHSPSGTVFTV